MHFVTIANFHGCSKNHRIHEHFNPPYFWLYICTVVHALCALINSNCVYVCTQEFFILYVAATVNFTQSVYRFDEDSGVVQLTLVLSNPSSADITVEALNTDESATGDLTLI